jgi:serine O-acetyltransferase
MDMSIPALHWYRFRLDAARWIRPQSIGDPADLSATHLAKLLVRHPPLRALAWFRCGSAIRALGIRGVSGWVQRRLLRLYGLELSIGAEIGGGLYIAHPVGCVLAAESIGSNVTVISLVTFGTRNDGRWPVIGEGAFFGAGARVLGGVTVGPNAHVGANAVVLTDVAPGTTVVGIPARPTEPRVHLT